MVRACAWTGHTWERTYPRFWGANLFWLIILNMCLISAYEKDFDVSTFMCPLKAALMADVGDKVWEPNVHTPDRQAGIKTWDNFQFVSAGWRSWCPVCFPWSSWCPMWCWRSWWLMWCHAPRLKVNRWLLGNTFVTPECHDPWFRGFAWGCAFSWRRPWKHTPGPAILSLITYCFSTPDTLMLSIGSPPSWPGAARSNEA